MKMGTYIKYLRESAKLSQEELGQSLNPPVNKAAVNKWETGQVENIKRTHIRQLAKKFGVALCDLMCFDDKFDSPKRAEEVKTLELVRKHYGEDAVKLLEQYMSLNQIGKDKVIDDISDLALLDKYTK